MHEATEETIQRMRDEDALVDGKQTVGQPSIQERLRQARAEMEEEQTIDLDIPGYRGMLVARYHLLAGEDLQKIGKRVRNQFRHLRDQQNEVVLAMASDILITACDGFYFRDEEEGLRPVTADGAPLSYSSGEALTEFLGTEPAINARAAVLAVFGGPSRDISVIEHYQRLFRWMRDTSTDVTADMLGEF